mmetsp:Transcript_43001/g.118950  ORF Transcript_43001/g.118950 Transcript_43001/m.118950 type:complete len:253 (+) Transcript_43001:557-1315(+)
MAALAAAPRAALPPAPTTARAAAAPVDVTLAPIVVGTAALCAAAETWSNETGAKPTSHSSGGTPRKWRPTSSPSAACTAASASLSLSSSARSASFCFSTPSRSAPAVVTPTPAPVISRPTPSGSAGEKASAVPVMESAAETPLPERTPTSCTPTVLSCSSTHRRFCRSSASSAGSDAAPPSPRPSSRARRVTSLGTHSTGGGASRTRCAHAEPTAALSWSDRPWRRRVSRARASRQRSMRTHSAANHADATA